MYPNYNLTCSLDKTYVAIVLSDFVGDCSRVATHLCLTCPWMGLCKITYLLAAVQRAIPF